MDKKSIIGFFLITLLLFIWLIYNQWQVSKRKPPEAPVQPQTVIDTSEAATKIPPESEEVAPSGTELPSTSLIIPDTLEEEKITEVETELYTAVFSSRGGVLKSFTLKGYKRWDTTFVQLIPSNVIQYPLNLIFPDSNFNLGLLNFKTDRDQLILDKSRPQGQIVFTLETKSGARLVKSYSFFNGRYDFKLEVELEGFSQLDLGREYLLGWGSGLNSTEKDRKSDLDKFAAYSKMGEELSDYKKFHQPKGEDVGMLQEAGSGNTKWVATRTKYFAAALAPLSRDASGFTASGTRSISFKNGEEIQAKRIGVFLEMPLERTASLKDSFMVYVGPLDYFVLKGYEMGWDRMVDLSSSIIRPFSIAVLWLFVNLHKIIPNYGLVIILFTILMKVAFHPLTRKSTTATMRMQALQPKLAQLKEKYKKDPARLNQETMKLYKQAGVNPLGGCLPLLLQMPVFWALFVVFRSTIELRGAKFIFWLTDLSLKDPYYVLPILMGVAMFWQQKLTIRDPKQAMLVYLMPIFFFFIFRNFPAGLTLYWTVFNILSLIEAYYFKHKGLHPSSLAPQVESTKKD